MSKSSFKDKLNGNELDLSLNEIIDVPVKEISDVPKATHVDLSCNKIEYLPSSFSSLTFLVRLDLSKNKLKELPTNFGCLRHLQHLDLYSNNLQVLPVSFANLKCLKWLDLKNNPLESHLKKAAGDCLDQKQCQQCATRVVALMQEIQSNLEREKQKKLKEERALEAARKAEEEKELQKQRQLKKAEKEKRKAMARNKHQSDSSGNRQQTIQQSAQNGKEKLENSISDRKAKGSFCRSMARIILFLMVLVPAMLFLTHLSLNLSKGPVPSTVVGAKVLLIRTWHDFQHQVTIAWNVLQSQSLILKKNAVIYSRMAYSKWFPQSQDTKREL